MQCTNPDNYTRSGKLIRHKWPCGKCLPCRLRDRRSWAARLILERKCYRDATFFTLTYDEKNNPGRLMKSHVQDWIKKLRYQEGSQPRYYICGEYGSRFGRSHYHGIFFGRPVHLENRIATRTTSGSKLIQVDPTIEDTWQKGSTYVKPMDDNKAIMAYVTNYVLKQNISENKSEWSLQSRKPFIGLTAYERLYNALNTASGISQVAVLGTVPAHFTTNGKKWPIDRRIRERLCWDLSCPLEPVPPNDGTIVDIEGIKVLRGKTIPTQTYAEAVAKQRTLERSLNRQRLRNTTLETG